MEMNKQDQEKFENILEGWKPKDNHILIVGESEKYKSPNGVISNLQQAGSMTKGIIIRIGNLNSQNAVAVTVEKEYIPQIGEEILFMKYDAEEMISDVYLLNVEKIKMYK